MTLTVFWEVTSLLQRRWKQCVLLNRQKFLADYTASHHRRLWSSQSPPSESHIFTVTTVRTSYLHSHHRQNLISSQSPPTEPHIFTVTTVRTSYLHSHHRQNLVSSQSPPSEPHLHNHHRQNLVSSQSPPSEPHIFTATTVRTSYLAMNGMEFDSWQVYWLVSSPALPECLRRRPGNLTNI